MITGKKKLVVLIYGMETGCSFLVYVFIARFLTWVCVQSQSQAPR